MGMAENNIEWGARGEIEFNIKSNLNKKLLFRQAVLYTFGQDCRLRLQSLINIHYLNWPIGFLHLFTCERFIPGKIMRFESQGRDFEFCPRGNTGLLIKTIKMLINMTFYIKNTNEHSILYKISCCLQMQKIPKTPQIYSVHRSLHASK